MWPLPLSAISLLLAAALCGSARYIPTRHQYEDPGMSYSNHFAETLGLVGQVLGVYITDSPNSRACNYPSNIQPTSTSDNLCGFACPPHFVAVGDKCLCSVPSKCGSAPPATYNDPSKSQRFAKRGEVSTVSAAQTTCGGHRTVCSTREDAAESSECIDAQTNLESCGDCTVAGPVGFGRYFDVPAAGVNCTAIPHADAVSCVSGRCKVQSCLDGWTANTDGSACIEDRSPDQSGLTAPALRRGPVQVLERNQSISEDPRSHTDFTWRIPDIRSEDEKADGDDAVDSEHLKADWMRIPDYRRVIRV